MYIYIYIYTYVCIYRCVHIYIYIYIYRPGVPRRGGRAAPLKASCVSILVVHYIILVISVILVMLVMSYVLYYITLYDMIVYYGQGY